MRFLSFIWHNLPPILEIVMVTWMVTGAVESVGRFYPSGFHSWATPVAVFLVLTVPFILGYLTAVLLIEED